MIKFIAKHIILFIILLGLRTSLNAQWVQLGSGIYGKYKNEAFGKSTVLTSDGKTLAIGGAYETGGGYIRIYKWNDSEWIQKGKDIIAKDLGKMTGSQIALSDDGNTLLVGSPEYTFPQSVIENAGQVNIYLWTDTNWVKEQKNITGSNRGDQYGKLISLSTDGKILAICSPFRISELTDIVNIYNKTATGWVKKDVSKIEKKDACSSLSLSSNGKTIATSNRFGGEQNSSEGQIEIFEWNGTEWLQKGEKINGKKQYEQLGSNISLSSDGNVLATFCQEYEKSDGLYRIFEWNNNNWIQKGGDIPGEKPREKHNGVIKLNSDGNIVAIGAPCNSINGNNAGLVWVLMWNGKTWIQQGNVIKGEAAENNFGSSISISADGKMLAIGCPGDDENGVNAGSVKVFYFCNTNDNISICKNNLKKDTVRNIDTTIISSIKYINGKYKRINRFSKEKNCYIITTYNELGYRTQEIESLKPDDFKDPYNERGKLDYLKLTNYSNKGKSIESEYDFVKGGCIDYYPSGQIKKKTNNIFSYKAMNPIQSYYGNTYHSSDKASNADTITEWFENGLLKNITIYAKSKHDKDTYRRQLNKKQVWYDTGILKATTTCFRVGTFRDTLYNEKGIISQSYNWCYTASGNDIYKTDSCYTYYKNGSPKSMCNLVNYGQRLTGNYKEWFSNGIIKLQGSYKDKGRNGLWVYSDSLTGEGSYSEVYKDGVLQFSRKGSSTIYENGLYGLYDEKMNILIPPEYSNILDTLGFYIVSKNGFDGLIDIKGKIIINTDTYKKILPVPNTKYFICLVSEKQTYRNEDNTPSEIGNNVFDGSTLKFINKNVSAFNIKAIWLKNKIGLDKSYDFTLFDPIYKDLIYIPGYNVILYDKKTSDRHNIERSSYQMYSIKEKKTLKKRFYISKEYIRSNSNWQVMIPSGIEKNIIFFDELTDYKGNISLKTDIPFHDVPYMMKSSKIKDRRNIRQQISYSFLNCAHNTWVVICFPVVYPAAVLISSLGFSSYSVGEYFQDNWSIRLMCENLKLFTPSVRIIKTYEVQKDGSIINVKRHRTKINK